MGLADVAEIVEAPATVAARATATVRAPAEGTIDRVYVSDGDRVKKGDLLVRIDSPTAREQLEQAREADRLAAGGGGGVPPGLDVSEFRRRADRTARRGFASARAAAKQIPDPERRARALAEIAKAEGEYAGASAAAQQAVARVNQGIGSVSSAMASITAAQRVQTKAAVRAAERTVEALEIRAPFSGVVGLGGPAGGDGGLSGLLGGLPPQLQGPAQMAAGGGPAGGLGGPGGGAGDATTIATGAPVSAGAAVVTVTDVSELRVSADVDETDVLLVKRGAPATVEFDAVPGATYPAKVVGVGVTPVQSGGGGVSYKVTLTLEEGKDAAGRPAPWPKPGMSAVADIRVNQVTGAVAVPASAVVSSGRDNTVWVVSGGRAQRRVVRLGAEGETMVQVVEGLRAGERVVVRGADTVQAGQRVP